ncbi:hypothetical protein SSX86_000583 [Deinandra increscens subsp. villosa]|uniref:Uncharacterized protein n=1 Tax=Deinandra increscens subsp. villosa TaxID=3103831 RepID=A0AAP0DWR3_9ASTR
MVNSGDKFASLLIPNCHRTASQEEKLHSSLFAREGDLSSSSPDDSSEQVTGIELVSLPDSSDEYQTPPEEQPFYSQNSSNDGHVAAAKTADFAGEIQGKRIVDLANESDDLDTEPMDVEAPDSVTEVVETEIISSPEQQSAHQVFVEMHVREKEQNIKGFKREGFSNVLNRVLKMAGEAKSSRGGGGGGGGEGGEVEVDFLETAKMRGLTFPRPRWWPAEGFKD